MLVLSNSSTNYYKASSKSSNSKRLHYISGFWKCAFDDVVGDNYYNIMVNESTDWGKGRINWVNYLDGRDAAMREGKPLMVVVHKDHCPACNHLSRRFAASDELYDLAKDFVMVQVSS